jgi:hypothetical protein
MKKPLPYLFFILFLVAACGKSPDSIQKINAAIPDTVFVPVALFGGPGNWGGGVCSWGYIMVRQDSSITYHSRAVPANVTVPNIPTLVGIQFHDTVQISSCWHEIVVDSIKF